MCLFSLSRLFILKTNLIVLEQNSTNYRLYDMHTYGCVLYGSRFSLHSSYCPQVQEVCAAFQPRISVFYIKVPFLIAQMLRNLKLKASLFQLFVIVGSSKSSQTFVQYIAVAFYIDIFFYSICNNLLRDDCKLHDLYIST